MDRGQKSLVSDIIADYYGRMDPVVTSSLIGAGADILSGAFGRGGNNINYPHHNYWMGQQQAQLNKQGLLGTVEGAREAGLHPLFALGGGKHGGSAGQVIPGQSSKGSFARDGLSAIASHFYRLAEYQARTNLVQAQREGSAEATSSNQISNDTSTALKGKMDKDLQVFKKGEFQAYNARHPEQSKDELSPMKSFRIGDQKVWLPVEDLSDASDNPLFVFGGAYLYHGNKNVDWARAYRDYTGARPNRSLAGERKWVRENLSDKAIRKKLAAAARQIAKLRIIKGAEHPGAYRRRGYAGPQPYRPRGWK